MMDKEVSLEILANDDNWSTEHRAFNTALYHRRDTLWWMDPALPCLETLSWQQSGSE